MLAVIGGTGFGRMVGLDASETQVFSTPYGPATLTRGTLRGTELVFLPRHGEPPATPPHEINYRANISALKDAGVARVISVNAVGSTRQELSVPGLMIPDQLIDYTWGRAHTFFDHEIHHIDFTYPYTTSLRNELIDIAREVDGIALIEQGVYGCTQGPRLETAAEIKRLANDGCDVVGMTGMPEAALAAEAEIDYASLSVIVNAGAGIEGAIDFGAIGIAMNTGMQWVAAIIDRFAASESIGSR